MKIDPEKVYSKFNDINESLARLRAFKDISLDEFLQNQDHQDIASFRLIVATEAAIDLCLHISARILHKVGDEYAACFKMLGDADIISPELAGRLADMARFRNLLVHRYWEIDYAMLYEIITGPDLEDLKHFVKEVGRLLD